MRIEARRLLGTFEITLNPIVDQRGYFLRTYCRRTFLEHGLQVDWQQENQSLSREEGTIRGLHFQFPPHSETKLLRVVSGAIVDVFVDLRKSSGTYGQWDSIELTEENNKLIYIPKGFAHGFRTLTNDTIVQYKVDSAYSPMNEGGLRWDDPDVGIVWGIEKPVISERDSELPAFKEFASPFE